MGDASDTPNVNFAIVALIGDDLRSHVEWTPENLLKPAHGVADCCKTEIGQFQRDLAVLWVVNEYVLGFYISMNDVLLVHVV